MANERPDYDQALKQLLGQAHDGVLALVAPELRFRRALSLGLPAGMRQADFVWEVSRPDGTLGLLHLELQTQVDASLGERMADYGRGGRAAGLDRAGGGAGRLGAATRGCAGEVTEGSDDPAHS